MIISAKKRLQIFLFVSLLLINAVSGAQDYLIQPGDVLQIAVWKEQDLQREVLVSPDGSIAFPLVGNLNIKNLAVNDVEKKLSEKLNIFIPEPNVSVALKTVSGNKIYILGEVNRPGEFVMERPLDVVQALSKAGGMTPYASSTNIKILRRNKTGEQQLFKFNFKKIKKGKDLDKNIILNGGDIVVVP